MVFSPINVPAKHQLLKIGILSLLVRSLVLLIALDSPVTGDEHTYWNLAHDILGGNYSENFHLMLWPFFISIPLHFVDHILSVRIVTVLMGSISPILIYLIGLKCFDNKTAYVSGLISSIYADHVFFSHYLYAEILLELMILISFYLMLKFQKVISKSSFFYAGFFILGIALLCKQFAVIPFLASVAAFFSFKTITLNKGNLARAVLLFIFPMVLFSFYFGLTGRDYWVFVNTPIKGMAEWTISLGGERFESSKRWEVLASHLTSLSNLNLSDYLGYVKKNLYNLWEPNTHAAWRLNVGYYSVGSILPLVAWLTVSHIFVVFTGIFGIVASRRDTFDRYAITSLVSLSLLSFLIIMGCRYRIPFMFLMILYSSSFLTDIRGNIRELKKKRRISFALLLMIWAFHITWTKFPNIGAEPP